MNGPMTIADVASHHSMQSVGSSGRPLSDTGTRSHDFPADSISSRWEDKYSPEAHGFQATLYDSRYGPTGESSNTLAPLSKRAFETMFNAVDQQREILESRLIIARTRISPRPAWRSEIQSASKREEIIAVFRLFGLNAIADRLGYLRSLSNDDPDEPPVEIESLRAMAFFLMSERQLPDPQIGVSSDGLAQIEWQLPAGGILAMVFLSSGLIRFAAVSAPAQPGVERPSVNGTLPKDGALAAVQPFIPCSLVR